MKLPPCSSLLRVLCALLFPFLSLLPATAAEIMALTVIHDGSVDPPGFKVEATLRFPADQREAARANFLAGVSHDLRTPLSRLRLGLEMLPADPATRSDLERDIADINLVIDQFLDFARDESGEPPQRMNLTQLARGAIERAARMQVSATAELADLPALMLRPVAMQRALDNLINNAARHGGGEILVQTRREADGSLLLSVLDRGPGIPPGEEERLKKAFARLDSARSGESGAGLGLAIVERIARMHGARFDLLPRVGGGTEARLTFTA